MCVFWNLFVLKLTLAIDFTISQAANFQWEKYFIISVLFGKIHWYKRIAYTTL